MESSGCLSFILILTEGSLGGTFYTPQLLGLLWNWLHDRLSSAPLTNKSANAGVTAFFGNPSLTYTAGRWSRPIWVLIWNWPSQRRRGWPGPLWCWALNKVPGSTWGPLSRFSLARLWMGYHQQGCACWSLPARNRKAETLVGTDFISDFLRVDFQGPSPSGSKHCGSQKAGLLCLPTADCFTS